MSTLQLLIMVSLSVSTITLTLTIYSFVQIQKFNKEVNDIIENKMAVIENIVKEKIVNDKYDKFKNSEGLFKIKRG